MTKWFEKLGKLCSDKNCEYCKVAKRAIADGEANDKIIIITPEYNGCGALVSHHIEIFDLSEVDKACGHLKFQEYRNKLVEKTNRS